MRVTVKLFARLRDLAGAGELVREIQAPATVLTVWKSLTAEMPSLEQYENTMSVAVNAEYAKMAAAVRDGDEVAFLPPVSGG
jgi:molybdopterin converting factor subunit 1